MFKAWPLYITWTAVVIVLAFLAWHWLSGDKRFDPVLWKRDTREAFRHKPPSEFSKATRHRMVGDLTGRYRLEGMKREEVIALLGEADFARSNTKLFPEWDLTYWLGPDAPGPFGGLDSLWLLLKLDTNAVVSEYRIAAD